MSRYSGPRGRRQFLRDLAALLLALEHPEEFAALIRDAGGQLAARDALAAWENEGGALSPGTIRE